jgi:hypothetical protein
MRVSCNIMTYSLIKRPSTRRLSRAVCAVALSVAANVASPASATTAKHDPVKTGLGIVLASAAIAMVMRPRRVGSARAPLMMLER